MSSTIETPLEAVAVIVPCFNAGPRLEPVVRTAVEVVGRVLVVDDGSTDGAVAALGDGPWQRLGWPQNRGKGFAIVEGLREAISTPTTAYVCIVDADGQHDPREIPKLLAVAVSKGADLVIGSRRFDLAQVPWRSRTGNRTTAWAMRCLLGAAISDTQSGFRLHSRRLVRAIVDEVEPGRYETEMDILALAVRSGYAIAETPIATLYEPHNASSHFRRIRDSWRVLRALFRAAAEQRRGRKDS